MKLIKSFAGTILIVVLLLVGNMCMNNTENAIEKSKYKYVIEKNIDYSSNVCKLRISNGDKSIWVMVTQDVYDRYNINDLFEQSDWH